MNGGVSIEHDAIVVPGRGIDARAYLAALLALLLVGASFLLQGRIGLNLADEGFLWHGAMRVLAGDIPLKDFQSYDPGRYYWSAFWMRVFGSDGIIALRLSVAMFQAAALATALVMLRRVIANPVGLVLAGLALLLWFVPRHKLFDVSFSIFAVYAGMALLERPSLRRHFAAGVYIGVAAFFGRNHGVYAAIALSGLAAFAWARLDRTQPWAKMLMLALGTVVGYSPMLFLAVSQPGFLQAVVDGVLLMFRVGATNLTLPVPWPWTLDYDVAPRWALHRLLVGLAFVALPLFYAAALVVLARQRRPEAIRRNSLPIAAVAVGVVYMHYAFSRAEVLHLAHSIIPFLIAVLSLPAVLGAASPWTRLAVPAAVLGFSVFAAGMVSSLHLHLGPKETIVLRGDTLAVDPTTARTVRAVQAIAAGVMRPGERIVVAPYWPTLYAVMGRTAPVWASYMVAADDTAGQQRFIDELEAGHVEWALIGNGTLDGREDLRFSRTHPLVWRHLHKRFEAVRVDGLPPDFHLLRRRAAAAGEGATHPPAGAAS